MASLNATSGAVAADARSVTDLTNTRFQLGENGGMFLISAPLNGNNWLTWSRSVRIALEGKDKLGFIDGSIEKPTEGTPEFKQWRITDSAVRTWILHTISKDIVNAFLFAPSTLSLWVELEARYGECDGPLLYRIQGEISSMSQGNLSVSTYFTNLKQLWDELVCLMPPAMCTCGNCTCACNKRKTDQMEANQLMQFLMGLSEPYDNIRSQILVLDPLPSVNKAFSMVILVERQRQVNLEYTETKDNTAMQAKAFDHRGDIGQRNFIRKRGPVDKKNLVCEHCKKPGHGKDTCFRIHGVPDWYKDLNEQTKRTGNVQRAYNVNEVQMTATKNEPGRTVSTSNTDLVSDLVEALRILQNRVPKDPVQDQKNKHTLAIGKQIGKLYFLDITSFSSDHTHQQSSISALSCFNVSTYDLWHKRLGHSSPLVMSHIHVLNISGNNKEHICTVCPLAKQARKAFSHSETHSQTPFELIHVDIWGPYKQPSLSRLEISLKILYKTPPSYTNLKTFGCLCFATNVTPHKAKFDPRAFKCVFIGYVHGQKAYKLYDLENKVTVISRDVVFHEAIFPFQNTSPTTENSFFPQSIPALDTILDDDVVHIHNAPNSTDTHPPDTSSIRDPPISSAPDHSSTSIPLRRSHRQSKPPSWLNDFHCNLTINPVIDPADLTLPQKEFLAALSIIKEPRCYMQAKDCKEWVHAMQQEIQALEKNQTWDIMDLPTGKKLLGVSGCISFSPVAKAVTVRTLLAVASGNRWPIHQVDINNAFLHGFLDEDIYMTAPDGYQIPSGKVYKLKRSLYGLKQASRQWIFKLTAKLISYGFTQSSHDYCLFFKDTAAGLHVLLIYVDDVLITCASVTEIDHIKQFLHSEFTIKDLGPAKYFLGLEIARSAAGTSVTQHKFIRDIIQDAGLVNAKPTLTPLPLGLKLSSHNSPVLTDPEPFRHLIGRLLYLNFTRPDISYGTQQLSQFVHKPCLVHMDAAFHLIRYLKGCPDRGLFFPSSSSFVVRAYCDADWASCVDSRRSLTGYCVFLGDALISWKTKKQPTVARSTAEAEYRSLGSTVCELRWITYLLQDLHVPVSLPIPLDCDNQAALHIVANPVFHERTKHLEIDCHLVRDLYKVGFVLPSHVSSKTQLADLFTKTLPRHAFLHFLSKMGLVSFPQVHLEGG
ncbi:UNVERIFIED_CONTAM: Retrovirus-related Pol polyprotein from transposon RE1 [Sesamum latifolium]|uniref:Retrovirus-related Pol polyprotein from transposon RE1 n=1 Tax=Sesamum latifolium TaxID=2727402 RepID=A0AAW2VHH6_9LAMI